MSSNSKALQKRSSDTALMPPPPAPKRIKRGQLVLPEDVYRSAVEEIIRRDFFPELAQLDAQHEYADALKADDERWIREAGQRLTQAMTPGPRGATPNSRGRSATPMAGGGATPRTWGGDTPASVAPTETEDEGGYGQLSRSDMNLSLSAFQAKYVSEDTESFSRIMDRENKRRFEKRAWVHANNMLPSKQMVAQQNVIEARASSQALTVRPSQDLDQRPASLNTAKHTAFNTLMFQPDSVEEWAPTRVQAAQSASLAPPKAVLHHNTRLPTIDPSDTIPRPSSPTHSTLHDALHGRPRPSASTAASSIVSGSETPTVNGYKFVDPNPEPQYDEPAPRDLLERFGAKTGPSPFRIDESSSREKTLDKMVEKINAEKAGRGNKGTGAGLGIFGGETPSFKSAPTPARMGMTPGRKNAGNLTPAAQSLLKKIGTPRREGGSAFGAKGNTSRRQIATPLLLRKKTEG